MTTVTPAVRKAGNMRAAGDYVRMSHEIFDELCLAMIGGRGRPLGAVYVDSTYVYIPAATWRAMLMRRPA